MTSMDLLGESDSTEAEDEATAFKINKNYAKNYDTWRKKEERQKLIDKYGDDVDDSGSSSEEEEIRTTKQMDKDWLRAYAVVRFNQPRLHKEGEKFFHDEAKPISKKKEKVTTLKDHERKFILEKGGIDEESDEESTPIPQGKSYFEEQEEIKKSFKDAVPESSEEDSSDDDLLVKRQKSQAEEEKEQNDYLEWLKGEKDELDDPEAAAELAPLKAYWNDPNLDEKEKVLRDYVLNNGYMDQEDSDESEEDDDCPDPRIEEDFLSKAEEYEHKYNFRHEEPGGDEIKSYPRVIETSVRPKDSRRAEKRQKKMEKKNQEKEKRRDEIRLLQKLQREERQEKLEKLRHIANNPDLDYDLDADFDPKEHAKIMEKFFSDDYYGDEVKDEDDGKPKFVYDPAIDDPDDWWDQRTKEDLKAEEESGEEDDEEIQNQGNEQANDSNLNDQDEPNVDDPNFIMDADYDPTRNYKAEKRRAKKYGKAFAKKLPRFDPTTKTFDEYIDEYLKDKINTLPFTYREVVPNDFGLTTEEILKAPERELNAWVSVKKMSMYRSKHEEMADIKKFQAHGRDDEKKKKVLPSLLKKPEQIAQETNARKKKKKKRKKRTQDDQEDSKVLEISNEGDSHTENSQVEEEMSANLEECKNTKKDGRVKEDLVQTFDSCDVKVKQEDLVQTFDSCDVKVKQEDVVQSFDSCDVKVEQNISDDDNSKIVMKKKKRKRDHSVVSGSEGFSKKTKLSTGSVSYTTTTTTITTTTTTIAKENRKTKKKLKNMDIVGLKMDKKIKKKLQTEGDFSHDLKNLIKSESPLGKGESISTSAMISKKMKKKSTKKKTSIPNFQKPDTDIKTSGPMTDRKKIKQRLEQIVSSSRLSKFGIGQSAKLGKKKKKKKKGKKSKDGQKL